MRRAPLAAIALLLVAAGCNAPPPTTSGDGTNASVKKASPKPAGTDKPAATPTPAPDGATTPTPTPAGTATPAGTPTPAATATPTPAGTATPAPNGTATPAASATPAVASPTPTPACTPADGATPAPLGVDGGRQPLLTLYSRAAVPGLDVKRADGKASFTVPGAFDALVRAVPGAAAPTIGGYQVGFYKGADATGTKIVTYDLTVPPTGVPAPGAVQYGAPATVPIVLPVGSFKRQFADAGTSPAAVAAVVTLRDPAGQALLDRTGAPLTITFPLGLGADATAAVAAPAADACPTPAPVPVVPAALPAGADGAPKALVWRDVVPRVVVYGPDKALKTTAIKVRLAVPPGAAAVTIAKVEAVYAYTTAQRQTLGFKPVTTDPIRTPLAAPVTAAAGTATAFGAEVEVPITLTDAAWKEGVEFDSGVVPGTFRFLDDLDQIINGPDGKPLTASLPILIE